jgi:hypothetical protein
VSGRRPAETLTKAEQIHAELRRLSDAGCDEVLLFPRSGEPEQVALLAEALRATGGRRFLHTHTQPHDEHMTDLSAATDFMAAHARLLDRRRFEVLNDPTDDPSGALAALCDWLDSISLPDGGVPMVLPWA